MSDVLTKINHIINLRGYYEIASKTKIVMNEFHHVGRPIATISRKGDEYSIDIAFYSPSTEDYWWYSDHYHRNIIIRADGSLQYEFINIYKDINGIDGIDFASLPANFADRIREIIRAIIEYQQKWNNINNKMELILDDEED